MTKSKKNNRPLILSVISIMICVVLLIGATIAWFTDTETNKGNVIQSGDLDIDVVWYEVDDTVTENFAYTITNDDYGKSYSFTFSTSENDFDGETPMISETNWQSGDYSVKLIKVTNNGSLDVDITLNAVVEDLGLEDALWYDFIKVVDGTATGTFDVRAMSSLSEVISSVSFSLDGTTDIDNQETLEFILIYGMLDSADNTYQNTGYTADIFLTATQKDQEETVVYASTVEDINKATTNQTVILMNDITEEEAVNLTTNVNFDLNGYTLTVPSFTMYTDDYCTVDIANGYIVATGNSTLTYDIDIQIPNGTINADDAIFAASSGEKIILDASNNTVNIMGSTNFVATKDVEGVTVADEENSVVPKLLGDTTVNMSGDYDIIFDSTDQTGVIINNLSEGTGTATATGEDVTYLADGEVVLTATEQFLADLESAVTGDTVTLTGHVTIDANLYIYGKAISIDMNGYNLTVNGVFLLDYSTVTDINDNAWYSIADGTVVSYTTTTYASGTTVLKPVYSKDTQESVFIANAIVIVVGSGNFGFNTAYPESGNNAYIGQGYVADECTFSISGSWENYTTAGSASNWISIESYLSSKDAINVATDTITIGTSTTSD